MKRLILILAMCLPMMAVAQKNDFGALVQKYQTKQGYTTIELSKDMLRTMGVGDGIERMMAISNEVPPASPTELANDVTQLVAGMNTMLSVVNNGCNVKIYNRTNRQGDTVELVIYSSTGNNIVVVQLTGTNIEFSDAQTLINF